MSEIPSTWKVVPLSSLAEVRLGRQRSPKRATGPNMRPYLRAANVTWAGIDVSDVNEMDFTDKEMETYRLRFGDILLSEASGSASEVGKPAVFRGEVADCGFQNTLIRVRAPQPLVPFLHLHFLKDALTGRFAGASRGVGIHHLGAEKMSDWEVVLPPPTEQRQIVAVIETQFTRLDAAVATLERVKANLKRARASVLKATVEGRLVPTEAELARAEGRPYEPASVLLERILEERRARWPKGKKYVAPVATQAGVLPGLPEGWAWASFDALAEIVGGVTKDQKQTDGRLVPYLRVANVQRGRLDLSEVKSIVAPEDKINALRLQVGDILLNEGGDRDKLGRGWIWQGELRECIHQNHVFRARVRVADLQPRYLSHYANTQGAHYFQDEGKQTTNLASISLSKVKALPVTVPPAAEQVRIVAEVERRLSLLDKLDATVDLNLARCRRLRQSILKRAFEGRLVAAHAEVTA